MPLDAAYTRFGIQASCALFAVVVEAVATLVRTHFKEVFFAALVVEGREGGNHKDSPDESGNHAKTERVLHSHVARVFDPLLQVHTRVRKSPLHRHFKEHPREVDD